jgi:WD40 repeat protein
VVLDALLHKVGTLPGGGRLLGLAGRDAVFLRSGRIELERLNGTVDRVLPLPAARAGRVTAISRSGSLVAIGLGDRVAVIDTSTGRSRVFPKDSTVTSLAFGPGGRMLAVGGSDGTVTLWTLASGRVRTVLRGHVGPVLAIAFSPRSTLIASASKDGTARVTRLNGTPVAVMSGHTNPITDVAFSPDGTRIVTASEDGTARVWKATTGAQLALLEGGSDPVTSARFLNNGYAVTGNDDGTVRLWYVLAQPRLRLFAQLDQPVNRAYYTNPQRIVAVTLDGQAHVFDSAGHQVGQHRAPPARPARSVNGAVAVIAGKTVRIHEPGGGVVVLRGHTAPVTSARFSADGRYVVTASSDTTARIWDASTGALLHTLRGALGIVSDASFSPDGLWVVTAGPSKAGLWSLPSGTLTFYLSGHRGPVTSASFDPSGTTILTSGVDGTVQRYDCEICRSGPALVKEAQSRLAGTRRVLTPAERARFMP